MFTLGFATDIHLDHVPDVKGYAKHQLLGRFLARGLNALVLGGDLSVADKLHDHMKALLEGAGIPVYFVLGSHDFYGGTTASVRATASKFPGYLDEAGVVELTPQIGLVGRSGWYDARHGNGLKAELNNDHSKIIEFLKERHSRKALLEVIQRWSDEETEKARPVLYEAARRYANVFFVTHFPISIRAYWSDSQDPWSISTGMGSLLEEVAKECPRTQFTVLTGHTHVPGKGTLAPNLTCISGKAQYGNPFVCQVWALEKGLSGPTTVPPSEPTECRSLGLEFKTPWEA